MDHEVQHGGIIRVTDSFLNELLSGVFKIDNTDTQGSLRDRGVFAEVHKRLLLPDTYIIHGIYRNWLRRYWEVAVEGPDLPELQEGSEAPVVSPIYRRHDDGRVELMRIEVAEDQWSMRAQ